MEKYRILRRVPLPLREISSKGRIKEKLMKRNYINSYTTNSNKSSEMTFPYLPLLSRIRVTFSAKHF